MASWSGTFDSYQKTLGSLPHTAFPLERIIKCPRTMFGSPPASIPACITSAHPSVVDMANSVAMLAIKLSNVSDSFSHERSCHHKYLQSRAKLYIQIGADLMPKLSTGASANGIKGGVLSTSFVIAPRRHKQSFGFLTVGICWTRSVQYCRSSCTNPPTTLHSATRLVTPASGWGSTIPEFGAHSPPRTALRRWCY